MTVTTLLQGFSSQAAFTSLLLLSSKGENPAQSKSDSIAGKKVFFFFSPPSPHPSLPPPSSPQSRLSVGGEIAVDCTYRGFSRFFFFFEKVWLLSRQITGDQDQVPQSEAALVPPPSRSIVRRADALGGIPPHLRDLAGAETRRHEPLDSKYVVAKTFVLFPSSDPCFAAQEGDSKDQGLSAL